MGLHRVLPTLTKTIGFHGYTNCFHFFSLSILSHILNISCFLYVLRYLVYFYSESLYVGFKIEPSEENPISRFSRKTLLQLLRTEQTLQTQLFPINFLFYFSSLIFCVFVIYFPELSELHYSNFILNILPSNKI